MVYRYVATSASVNNTSRISASTCSRAVSRLVLGCILSPSPPVIYWNWSSEWMLRFASQNTILGENKQLLCPFFRFLRSALRCRFVFPKSSTSFYSFLPVGVSLEKLGISRGAFLKTRNVKDSFRCWQKKFCVCSFVLIFLKTWNKKFLFPMQLCLSHKSGWAARWLPYIWFRFLG